ncbi:MAG: HAD family hydrolase [Candidatus Cloacimonetes bacterium]|nr:HAD family hydrolase [Candidatus Cloacimonadota bacterium]MCF7813106.1 HAD family hydrolase [Candidatus Cloacimonadota bacterium]MCF7867554.1 HAD family hydrolase [Candidatus Cloacimonadota bacterium]MCF7883052.1 HAD family hydrolase [Candidatus Cloacimonadota bacterium]
MKKAVFLDRDGTINSDENGYINKPEDFELYEFTAEAIRKLNEMDFLVFVITNQSGIARGFYTENEMNKIHQKMLKELQKHNAEITEIFHSPYHKDGKIAPFTIDHEDRKPGLGMFKKACEKYNFSIKESYMIGDKYADIEFGKKAGLTTILVRTGYGEKEFLENRKNWKYKPDFIAEHLLHAVLLIEKLEKKK